MFRYPNQDMTVPLRWAARRFLACSRRARAFRIRHGRRNNREGRARGDDLWMQQRLGPIVETDRLDAASIHHKDTKGTKAALRFITCVSSWLALNVGGRNKSATGIPGSVGGAGRLPGDHLPLAGLVDPDIGKADAEIHRVAAGIDADAGVAGEDDRVAEILRLYIRGHDRGVDRTAGFHRADQALFRVEPRRRMGVDEIVRNQVVQRGDVFLRHRAHALAVEVDGLLSIAGHGFPPTGLWIKDERRISMRPRTAKV